MLIIQELRSRDRQLPELTASLASRLVENSAPKCFPRLSYEFHKHIHTHTHARIARDRQPLFPRPPRSRAEFPPLLIVRSPAPARPAAAPPDPAAALGELLGEGAEASADGTGRESSQQRARGRSRAVTVRAAATFPPRFWLRVPAQLCGRQEEQPDSDSRVPGCRQASRSGADSPAGRTPDPAPEPQPPAPSPRTSTTMRPTLALSALLLLQLLLLSTPSLSQDNGEWIAARLCPDAWLFPSAPSLERLLGGRLHRVVGPLAASPAWPHAEPDLGTIHAPSKLENAAGAGPDRGCTSSLHWYRVSWSL